MFPRIGRFRLALVWWTASVLWSDVSHAAQATFSRVLLLPLADRASLVVEMSESVEHVEEVASNDAVIEVIVGPVTRFLPAEFSAPPDAKYVKHVSIGLVGKGDREYLRLSITRRLAVPHRLRVAGARIYVDFVPESAAVRVPIAPAVVKGRGAEAPTDPLAPTERRQQASGPELVDVEAAYRTLELTTRRRARDLLARPDVRGLLRLQDEVERRDAELGRQRPELVARLQGELQEFVEAAQALQLQKDREQLLRYRQPDS
jgi:hypothetical protein